MANVHCFPGDEYSDKIYFDSAMPGSAIYHAEELLQMGKDMPHPALAAFALQQYDWALNGEMQPQQKPQYYHQLYEKKLMFGQSARRVGSYYYGPENAVRSTSLRPKNAKPLGPADDN